MEKQIINKLNTILNGINTSQMKLNNMYDGNYVFTLDSFIDMFRNSAKSFEIAETVADAYLLKVIKQKYLPQVQKQCAEIAKIPIIEQKTPEWYKQRETMISASDSGYFLKKCGASKAVDTLKIKVGCKQYASSMAKPLLHGNTYEDVSRAIYESRNAVKVTEYGILSSPTACVGASPDGVITACHKDTLECQSKYGRLLEIKNPYSREINDEVMPEYMVQILQQQYTTQLPVCDFVETTIVDINCNTTNMNNKPYTTLEEMLADVLDTNKPTWQRRVKNRNIPYQNLNKFGNEKGLVVWYSMRISADDTRHRYVMYPLEEEYSYDAIKKWIVEQNAKQFQDKYEYICTKYWRLDVYDEKTVVYNANLFEGIYLPELCKIWDVICKCRQMRANGDDVLEYIESMEKDSKSPFHNPNKRKKKVVPVVISSESDDSEPKEKIYFDF